eukprot:15032243-Heterocapsa_arctica.AAC.1
MVVTVAGVLGVEVGEVVTVGGDVLGVGACTTPAPAALLAPVPLRGRPHPTEGATRYPRDGGRRAGGPVENPGAGLPSSVTVVGVLGLEVGDVVVVVGDDLLDLDRR